MVVFQFIQFINLYALSKIKYKFNIYMESLIVYKNEFEKIRLGSTGDGGYIISDLSTNYDCFISCGISDNLDFEVDFIKKYMGVPCFAFDGTIDRLPKRMDEIKFNKMNIGIENTNKTTNLKNLIVDYHNIMLKMDIETYEFRWLNTLTIDELNKFKQIVIEFHFPFSDYSLPNFDEPQSSQFKMGMLEKLSKTHYLIHFHPNTACGLTKYKNYTVPNVFECTYIRKDCQNNIGLNDINIPHPLDMKNRESDKEIYLSGYPFSVSNSI